MKLVSITVLAKNDIDAEHILSDFHDTAGRRGIDVLEQEGPRDLFVGEREKAEDMGLIAPDEE